MRQRLTVLMLGCLAALALLAADVSGKWQAEMTTPNGDKRVSTFNLKADGGKLTGTVEGGMGGSAEISDGKVDGDNVSFNVVREFNGNSMTLKYTGKVEGDSLKLTVETPRGSREMVAKRNVT